VELPLTTPSTDHVEFDQMCVEVDEFESLPSVTANSEPESVEETSLDGQILAGLVTP
jgi:hypothetical protein